MNILLKIVWDLIKNTIEAIGVFVVFVYVLSGFGLFFAMGLLAAILDCTSNSSVLTISLIFFILIVISWVVLIIRWLKVRIKQEIKKL